MGPDAGGLWFGSLKVALPHLVLVEAITLAIAACGGASIEGDDVGSTRALDASSARDAALPADSGGGGDASTGGADAGSADSGFAIADASTAGADAGTMPDSGVGDAGWIAPADAGAIDYRWAQWPVPPDSPSNYVVGNDGTVLDALTGLYWQQQAPAGTYSLASAQGYCSSLALGGKLGWR